VWWWRGVVVVVVVRTWWCLARGSAVVVVKSMARRIWRGGVSSEHAALAFCDCCIRAIAENWYKRRVIENGHMNCAQA